MHFARSLLLLVMTALAAMALSATTASAQLIEVHHEETGNHCGDVTVTDHEADGECLIVAHDVQSPHLPFPGVLLSAGGTTLSVCHNEFEGYVGEDGSGSITHQTLDDVVFPPILPPDSCQVTPCVEIGGGQEPWPLQVREEAGAEILRTTFCVNNMDCTIDVRIIQTGHHYNFRAEDSPCLEGTGVEVTGRWESEPAPTEEGETETELVH